MFWEWRVHCYDRLRKKQTRRIAESRKMLGYYIATDKKSTLERAYDNLKDQLYSMEVLNGLSDAKANNK